MNAKEIHTFTCGRMSQIHNLIYMFSPKLISLAYTAFKSNFGSLKRPYKLNFSITYWCQSKCLTCNIWKIKPKGELTLNEIKEFAKKNTYFKWIELTGGEPFLRSDIVEIAKTFKDNSKELYMLTMPTNSLCNHEMVEKKIRKILNLKIPKVVITLSLDGYRELEDKIRGVTGNFDRVIKMAKLLQSLKKEHNNLDFVFGYTLSKYNQGELETTYNAVKREIPNITPNDFHVNIGQLSSNYYSNNEMNMLPDKSIVINDIQNLIKRRRKKFDMMQIIETTFLKNLVYYIQTGKPPMRSRSLDASLFLDSFGNIYPSIMWDKKIANIKDINYDLSKIWNSGSVKELRKAILEGKEPKHWTACEAYQSIVGDIRSML